MSSRVRRIAALHSEPVQDTVGANLLIDVSVRCERRLPPDAPSPFVDYPVSVCVWPLILMDLSSRIKRGSSRLTRECGRRPLMSVLVLCHHMQSPEALPQV